MKKLISIGVALALLAMVVVPLGVAAQDEPATYSKTPFAILGSAIELVGEVVMNLGPTVTDQLPFDVSAVTGLVGPWVSGEFAWLTDMTGWTFVAIGDVIASIQGLADTFGFGDYTGPIADMLYVLGGRMSDAWGSLTVTGNATLPAPGIGLPIG